MSNFIIHLLLTSSVTPLSVVDIGQHPNSHSDRTVLNVSDSLRKKGHCCCDRTVMKMEYKNIKVTSVMIH